MTMLAAIIGSLDRAASFYHSALNSDEARDVVKTTLIVVPSARTLPYGLLFKIHHFDLFLVHLDIWLTEIER